MWNGEKAVWNAVERTLWLGPTVYGVDRDELEGWYVPGVEIFYSVLMPLEEAERITEELNLTLAVYVPGLEA